MYRVLAALFVLAVSGRAFRAQQPVAAPDSVRFAVIGDNWTGDRYEYEVAQQMVNLHQRSPFEFVIMLGDNICGRQKPKDFVEKFGQPYRPLLDAGVRFYASLGNHDDQSNRLYKPFNMNGERYYTFARKNVRFFVLDSDYLDPKQLAWIDGALKASTDEWKICYFHHPLYSNGGRHGSQIDLRVVLEPLFVKHGVNVVFSGHDHIYERMKPQRGIQYFVAGSAGQIRRGDLERSEITAAGYDEDQTFMLVEVAAADMSFQAITRTGKTVDSGVIHKEPRL